MSRQKELDADPEKIKQTEFFGQLKNDNNQIFANETIFLILTILEKIKKTRLKKEVKQYYKRWQIIKKWKLNWQIHN